MNNTIKKIDAYLEQFVGSTMEQMIMQEAKNEINKLTAEVAALKAQRDEADAECREANASWCREIEECIDLNRELAQRTAERDEARRELCELKSRLTEDLFVLSLTPAGYAKARQWDCFKEEQT
jgi:uncharacterized coiled-coil DUF342 family protein